MGDAQSAQRDGKEDEESVPADDAHGDQTTTDKALPNNGKISGLSGKTDDPIAEVNGHNEEEVVAEVCDTTSAVASPKEDVPDIEEPLKDEEAPLENVELNEKESPDADKAALPNETEAKMNEINDGFKKFFSNIGLKLTVKRGSTEKPEVASDAPVDTKEGEPSSPDDVKETTKETTSENAEHTVDLNTAQETPDNDSTTCPTMTDMTLEDIQENAEEKTTETTEVNEEVTSDKVEALTTTAVAEEGATPGEDTAPNKEPEDTSPTSPDEEEVMSPIKKFFTKGIFSGLRKKKKPVEEEKAKDETLEKELVDMRTNENAAKTEEAGQDQEQVKEEVSSGVETAAVEQDQKEHELKEEITPAASDTALTTNAPEIGENDNTVNEQELLSSQERVKVQGSPLKRLLSGSSLKKLSKKQRGRKSSEPKLTDSGEHVSDQLLSSTESAEHRREKSPAGSPEEVAQAEDGTWASFKKLVTPKKAVKRSSLGNEEAVISGTLEEPKPNEGEQISDDSTEETKKRKDSSVSWEAFLCGSGSRRSRKTSDSDGETPQNEGDDNRPEGESRHAAESPLERSHEGHEHIASSPEQPGSLSDGEGGSAWKSIKKLVTPKRKAKEEEESKDRIPSDCEMSKDESSFSIKKLLPGRKKRKSAEKQEQLSSDEAERGVGSEDEDSETPAVVPLSEFDTFETEDQIQTQVVIESHIHQAEDYEPQQDLSVQPTEPALPSDPEPEKVQDNDNALENEASTIPASNEEADELTEVISKHQQLSDIPEEGIIEESMATPASVAEEATRDDTIAEDLIELTSEAVTAPEPVDITLADETEMVSAVSQLTESSKTSGNTTPVPAEYDVKETEDLLHQVVETIGVSVCENDPSLERIVGSVSPDILKTSVEREAVILETDATALCTGLSTEEFDAINKIASQTECVSEVTETISTELVSEDTTEEFDTAGITVDEVHYAGVSQAQESVKESESIDESQLQVECVSGVIGSATTEVSLGDEEVDTAQVSVDGGEQDEAQPAEMASQESDSAPVEDEDQTAKTGETLQTSIPVEAAALDSEEGSAHVPESKVITEGTEADDAMDSVTDEPIQETQEVGVDGDEDKPLDVEIDAAEVEHAPANAELENQNISEDILAPSADDAISSFTDKMDEAPQDVVAEDEAPRDVVAEDEAPRDVVAEDEDKLSEVNEPVTFEQGTTVELEQSEMLDRKLGEVEVQQIIEDSSEVVIERPAESLAVEDVSVHRHKEVLEKTTVELKMQPDAPEDSTCSSEAVVVRKLKEDNAEVQIPQTNSCLVVPQNTGLISSIGNVESPSSLSLEFKLNIQFGQAKAPPPPLPLIGKIEGLKQTEVSDVGVQATEKTETKQKSAETLKQPAPLETGVQVTQAAEPVQQITASEISVSHNDLELSEVAFQVTEIVASATQLDSTERDVILNKPAELQVGTQPTEMAEITPIEKAVVYSQPVLSDIGALVAGTVQPVMQMEATESTVIASQTVVSEVCAQETGAIKPVQIEEEYDQDVWLDAEEDISAQGGTGRSCIKAGESLESEKENSQGEERIVDDDTAQRSQTEGDKSHEEIPKTGTISDVECEGDDFAIALEQPEPETAMETSVPTLEWD
ncbi:uncharacterized protein akap12a [Polymixia lowei]